MRARACGGGRVSGSSATGATPHRVVSNCCRHPACSLVKKTVAVTHESPHPYPDSHTMEQEVRIPGAKLITIKFDAQSRTEMCYDYIQFFSGPDKSTQ